MSDTLQQYINTAERIGSDSWLGRLHWYSLSGVRMLHGDVVRALVEAGISNHLPPPPADDDVFRRICTSVKRTKVPTSDPNVLENYMLREFKDDRSITRRVVRERVDSKGRKLDYVELVDIVFDRATSIINITAIVSPTPDVVGEMVQEVLTEFDLWRGHLGTYAIREWIRAFLLRLGATRVRPGGGVYFVREEFASRLAALEVFGSKITGECEFHSLPLIDDAKQRDMVARAFEAEVSSDVDDILGEMTKITQEDRKITADKYARFVTDYQQIVTKAQDYSSLLEQKLDSTNARLSVYQTQLLNLRLQVKDES